MIGRVRGTCRLKMQQQQAGWGVVLILCQQFEMQNTLCLGGGTTHNLQAPWKQAIIHTRCCGSESQEVFLAGLKDER